MLHELLLSGTVLASSNKTWDKYNNQPHVASYLLETACSYICPGHSSYECNAGAIGI